MTSDKLIEITDGNFDGTVVKSEKPVLLDFWAPWCAPCLAVTPILEELATDYDGKIQIGKVNVDENRKIATQFQIRSIPTLLLFKSGNVIAQKVGAGSKAGLEEFIKKAF